ncbi:Hsp20/alpha crystallin family protein [Patescibacteria group bacterium]|nr:Hsp20/alpha crystallin family protein [Patescibacteria group bacterium]MBU1889935.1 Hsp20/alpha crystallin family protein [Patescibacteria group bacterium]
MRMIKWQPSMQPWEDMDRMMEEFMPTEKHSFVPAIDVYQTKEAVVVETTLAGIKPEDVNISIENDVLTIEGRSEKKSEVDDKEYYRKEIRSGSFHRAIALPTAVKGDNAKAIFDNGVLKIMVPKEERVMPKTIKVQVKSSKGKK